MSKIMEGRFNKRHIRISCKFGYCYYSFENDHGSEYVHIYKLFVFPDYRGQRKARVILQKAIDEIRENEYMGDIEIVARPNDNSIDIDILKKFYKSMGLKVFSCYSKEKVEQKQAKKEVEETNFTTGNKQSEEIKPCKRSGDCAHERVTGKCLGVECGVYLPA